MKTPGQFCVEINGKILRAERARTSFVVSSDSQAMRTLDFFDGRRHWPIDDVRAHPRLRARIARRECTAARRRSQECGEAVAHVPLHPGAEQAYREARLIP